MKRVQRKVLTSFRTQGKGGGRGSRKHLYIYRYALICGHWITRNSEKILTKPARLTCPKCSEAAI